MATDWEVVHGDRPVGLSLWCFKSRINTDTPVDLSPAHF
jgi:hypothetical protein